MKQAAIAIALLSATSVGFADRSQAMPLPAQGVVKAAAPSDMTEVRWRHGGWWGPGIGFGIAAGALAGAAVASTAAWGPGYWGGYPAYSYAPGYAYGYGYAPAYSYGYGPSYGYSYAPAYSYSYAYEPAVGYGPAYASYPAYSSSYRTTYVRPRARYTSMRARSGVRFARTSISSTRVTDGSALSYRSMRSGKALKVKRRR
jgi:hypothetical protein